jgi:DNA repair protein RadC
MHEYNNQEFKKLISECLREQPDSYVIQELFQQFPTPTEFMDVPEQQLVPSPWPIYSSQSQRCI